MFDHFCGLHSNPVFVCVLTGSQTGPFFKFYFTSSLSLKVMVCEMEYAQPENTEAWQ